MSHRACLALGLALAGCVLDRGARTCTALVVDEIDTGASFSYTPGIDAGYYVSYLGGGHWHVEWTCDTKLSAAGCNFSGSIVADTPAQGPNASCYQCEGNDAATVGPSASPGPSGEAQMRVDFNTVTTTATDGVDFVTTPGSTVSLDLLVDGLEQPDLVFFVSRGGSASPSCGGFELTPNTP
jgi:hypothetical protein